jgi:hypothetical protein
MTLGSVDCQCAPHWWCTVKIGKCVQPDVQIAHLVLFNCCPAVTFCLEAGQILIPSWSLISLRAQDGKSCWSVWVSDPESPNPAIVQWPTEGYELSSGHPGAPPRAALPPSDQKKSRIIKTIKTVFIWLVVSEMNDYFPSYMGCHSSHWLSYFSRWLLHHQPDSIYI